MSKELTARNRLRAVYRRNAKVRGLSFELSDDDFAKLTKQECAYCGVQPSQLYRHTRKNSGTYLYNGIDRIDNSAGYVADNCVTACKTCNRAKNDLPMEVFVEWVRRLSRQLLRED